MFKHLRDANKTYTSHFWFAAKNGFVLVYAGLTSIVHAIYPSVFKFTSRNIVAQLAEDLKDIEGSNWTLKR